MQAIEGAPSKLRLGGGMNRRRAAPALLPRRRCYRNPEPACS